MIHQPFALCSILSLAIISVGCTSSVPTFDHAGEKFSTTKTTRQSDEAAVKTDAAFLPQSNETDQFVNTMREWKDNESQFSTNAELLSVSIKRRCVKLLKENGVTVDVSIDRLSQHDRNFLTQAVYAMRDKLVKDN